MTKQMRETQQKDLTLVIGGTGKTGRRVAERLAARGVPTRIGSRSSELPFDWEKEATWGPALQNVVSVYVTYFPDLVVPAALDDIRAFSKLAVESGVKRLVLLSGRGEDEAQHCERLVQESGAEWTIVRASWFAQNFSEAFLLEPLLGGVLALPAGSVGEPFVDAEDIADVAVAALTEDGHSGQIYEVTGPRLLTFTEAVAEIAKATGRDLSYVQISNEEYSSQMAEHGVPEDVIGLITYLFDTVLDGRNSSMTDGVQRALGRPPRDFADYARDTAATGIWNVEGDAQ
jgi:uncharacterized protein YbjT (DUF2867 family)